MTRIRFEGLAMLAILVSACACTTEGPPTLPDEVGDWTARTPGATAVYVGDELFEYINGGAEIYHEFGFREVVVADYERGADRISVELYTMSGSAYGIFTFARSPRAEAVQLGDAAALADYYLHIWSGNSLAVITAQNEFPDRQESVTAIGRAVSAGLEGGGSVPEIMHRLPTGRRIAGSQAYLQGPIALYNLAAPLAPILKGFDEAATARYRVADGSEVQLVLLRYADASAASEALREASQRTEPDPDLALEAGEGGMMTLVSGDWQGTVEARGDTLAVAMTRGAEASVHQLIGGLQ